MRKIPTLFERTEDRRFVIDQVAAGSEWVLMGQGVATRKFDGTGVLIRRDGMAVHAYSRREVKPGKRAPANFRLEETDPVTGKQVGWEPAAQSGFAKFIAEVISEPDAWEILAGTYELCGPKVNGNPEGFDRHVLVRHGAEAIVPAPPLTFSGLRDWMQRTPFEGIVWWREPGNPNAGLVKLKRRDFPQVEQ